MAHRNAGQLDQEFGEHQWRAKFASLCDLIEVLADCIIADDYSVSDALNEAIILTSDGAQMRDRLIRKESVPTKEARLMCLLTLGHEDLFVDVDRINIEQLAAAINAELVQGKLKFPFMFGRDLYDRYADLYDDEKESLTPDETQRLLEGMSSGVFQYGSYSIGPYGLREAPTWRTLPATRRVPAYHCSRTVCRQIHSVLLETSHSAAINHHRDKLGTILRNSQQSSSEWWQFAARINGIVEASLGDTKSAVILPLLGDCLSLTELRHLFVDLLDGTRGQFRSAIASVLKIERADSASVELDRAELLQLTLFATESQIATSVDRLVRSGRISIPPGEVRRPVVTSAIRSGAFRLQAELGHHGVRFASADPGFALLRQRRLLDRLYLRDMAADVAELEWQLRGIDVESLDERLDKFFWHTDPRRALERLVLARRTNVITACEDVGLQNSEDLSDGELIETILWKLGFESMPEADPHVTFWQRHERLWALTQSSNIGASERFLESASPYFSHLEGLLLDSLAFSAWALLTDHVVTESPFSYDDEEDRQAGLSLMNGIAPSPTGAAEYSSDRVDLGNLIGGFSALGSHLERCANSPGDFDRPSSALPEYDGKTDIKAFLLRSTLPFLNLMPSSRERIIAELREITRLMTKAELNLVRNDYSHYRRNPPDVERVESALEATRQAVTRIETSGFCRLLFTPVRVLKDSWGRSSHEFRGPRSYEHAFSRPTRFDWMGLPSLERPAYLMRSASVGEPTEIMRFVPRYSSDFSQMWSGYPNRRRAYRSSAPEEPDAHGSQISASAI